MNVVSTMVSRMAYYSREREKREFSHGGSLGWSFCPTVITLMNDVKITLDGSFVKP